MAALYLALLEIPACRYGIFRAMIIYLVKMANWVYGFKISEKGGVLPWQIT
jgi:hypothetical protein